MMFGINFQSAHGRQKTFAERLKADVEAVQKAADKDPDTFKENMAGLENALASLKDAAEASVAHAMLASCYKEMSSYMFDYDEETQADFERKTREHFARVLDDMEALASARAAQYAPLLKTGDDGDLFDNDMLSVMLNFMDDEAEMEQHECAEMYRRAADIYKRRGNANAHALVKMRWLACMTSVEKQYTPISSSAKKDSLYQLLQEVKTEEVGADVAMEYLAEIFQRDERILFLQWAVENVAKSKRTKDLDGELAELLRPSVTLSQKGKVMAARPFATSLLYWNCDSATVTIRKYAGLSRDGHTPLANGKVVARKELGLGGDDDNLQRKARRLPVSGTAEMEWNLPVGHYVMVADALSEKVVREFHVTSMQMVVADRDSLHARVYVLDNETGRPVGGVKVEYVRRPQYAIDKDTIREVYTTTAEGWVDVPCRGRVRCVRAEGDFTDEISVPWPFESSSPDAESLNVRIFTERSIYRPGQTVSGSVMLYYQNGDALTAARQRGVKIVAEDGKRKKIQETELVTNEFGTASFEVTLPADCEVGTLVLRVTDESGRRATELVSVEEYKRPTFDVTFDETRGGSFGDSIEVAGFAKLFAGAPVQNAQVRYTVQCAPTLFRWWRTQGPWEDVAEGECVTDAQGGFRVPFVLTDEHMTPSASLARFKVTATVTSLNGETHEAVRYLNVSRKSFDYEIEMRSVVDKADSPSFKVNAFNINLDTVEVRGWYHIMYADTTLYEGTFTSGEEVRLPDALKGGVNYSLKVIVFDEEGMETSKEARFTAYDSSLKPTSVFADHAAAWSNVTRAREAQGAQEHDFLYSDTHTFQPGGSVNLYFATRETDACIIYNVYNAKGLLEQHWAVTDGQLTRLKLDHREEWGDAVAVTLTYVRNGHFCTKAWDFKRETPEKKMRLEWKTFRDKLLPGQDETWTLQVTDPQGNRVDGAEMMAVLYDAALDRIKSHQWHLVVNFHRPSFSASCETTGANRFPTAYLNGKMPHYGDYSRVFDSLRGFVHNRWRAYDIDMVVYESAAAPLGATPSMMRNMAATRSVAAKDMAAAGVAGEETEDLGMESGEDFDNAVVRGDFSETAVFLPHLVSDTHGNVNIQFTIPESLTEWKFMGLAHTKAMDYGLIEGKATTCKPFMVQPNVPRFVRWNDRVVVSASVLNQSETPVSGAARMRLLDHETGAVVLTSEQPFAVEAGLSVAVSFEFVVQEEWNDLDCEIVAVSGNVSDGERRLLPVLSTKKDLVEAIPFYIKGGQDGPVAVSVDMKDLFNGNSPTATRRALKVEYTDSPAWMCIEALRSVKRAEDDDAIDLAVCYYANSRLLELMKTFPVMEKTENADSLRQRAAESIYKLRKLQLADGGWSWFEGMDGSVFTTLAVCEQLVRMHSLDNEVEAMLERGLAFLDTQELKWYEERRKNGWDLTPGDTDITYLMVMAQRPGREVAKEVRNMRKKYVSLLEKNIKDLTIYGVARTSSILRSYGKERSANKFVDFLKEYTVERPGQGRFYATDAAYYSWRDYRIPTQVAAMRAIMERKADDDILNDMLLWIISQKQVQRWDNPLNTIDVADLLMRISPEESFHESVRPELSINGHPLTNMEVGTINTERDALEEREANLALEGNVLVEVDKAILDSVFAVPARPDGTSGERADSRLSVVKSSPGISWGAAYATFNEDISNVKMYATAELRVERKFYRQEAGASEWREWTAGQPLKVGDKLRVRHIVTADRDMDFVRVAAQYPSCLEPIRQLSGYQSVGGRWCSLSIRDSHFNLFYDRFTRGTTTADMDYYVVRPGEYQTGVSSVECAYAKQFGGHTDGYVVTVGQ